MLEESLKNFIRAPKVPKKFIFFPSGFPERVSKRGFPRGFPEQNSIQAKSEFRPKIDLKTC